MKPLTQSPPRTIMEVYKSLPEGTLAELIGNTLYMSPSPIYNHQIAVGEIFRKLCSEIVDKKKGKVITSPFDVYLDEVSNAVQPDIIIVLNRNIAIIDPEGHIHGSPDILVEVLSPGNREHDQVTKKALYERFGVKEYWVVDPDNKSAIVYGLTDNRYALLGEKLGCIKSRLLNTSIQF